MKEFNTIYNEDCLVTLKNIDDNSIDLIVTSPPYNKGYYASKNQSVTKVWSNLNGRKINYDKCSDDMLPSDYEKWQKEVISECIRVLKPTGSLFYNHKDIINHGVIVSPKWVYDFKVRQQIIWDRQSSCMLDKRYFMPANEWIYWIVKDEKKVYFDKSKSVFKTNIWRFNAEKNPHPAPFPLIMARNIISCTTSTDAVIYDPFMGSGTTAIATIQVGGGRKFIGSEISENYCDMANKRINVEQSQLTLF